MHVLSPRGGRKSPKNQVKIANNDSLTFEDEQIIDNQPFSFNQKQVKITHKNIPKNYNLKNFPQGFLTSNLQTWEQKGKFKQLPGFLNQLAKNLQKVSYTILKAQYGSAFTQNPLYVQHMGKLQQQTSIEQILYFYTSLLLKIIQAQEQSRLNSPPKQKRIRLQKSQRIKLKLILNRQQQDQINKFNNKGLQTYVKKVEDQAEKYKREHVRIRERNRTLQNQLIKLSLEFKNKRELYLAEITRLTEILHSSFMEVGKMFVNLPAQNSYNPQGHLHKYDNNVVDIKKLPRQPPVSVQLTRKNVKSLSPTRKVTNYDFIKDEQETPNFVKPHTKANSNNRNYGSSIKPQSMKNAEQNLSIQRAQKRINKNFEVESQPALIEKKKQQQTPYNLKFSAANFPQSKNTFE